MMGQRLSSLGFIDYEPKLELWLIFILTDVKQINELAEALLYIWENHNTILFFYICLKKVL